MPYRKDASAKDRNGDKRDVNGTMSPTWKVIAALLVTVVVGIAGFFSRDMVEMARSADHALADHKSAEGHPVIIERVRNMEQTLRTSVKDMRQDLSSVKNTVAELRVTQNVILNEIRKGKP